MIASHSRSLRRPSGRAIIVLLLAAFNTCYGLQQLLTGRTGIQNNSPVFDGPPLFVSVEGNDGLYATNSSSTILHVGGFYYLYRDGEWFRSTSARGPYAKTEPPPAQLFGMPGK